MASRSAVPFLVLAIVGVLTVGAVVLGLEQAPATANLLVHNAAGALVAAPSFTFDDTVGPEEVRVDYTAPGRASESLVTDGRVEKTVHLDAAQLQGVMALLSLATVKVPFTAHGAEFVATEPAADVYPPAERSQVKGTARFAVRLRTGYAVEEDETVRVVVNGTTKSGSGDLAVKSIGGQAVGGR